MTAGRKGHDSAGARFQQVYDAVMAGLREGEWDETGRLPSVRTMAERLGVHRLTVLKAYRKLKEDGVIESRYKSGYYTSGHRRGKKEASSRSEAPWDYQAQQLYVNRSRLADIHRVPVDFQMSEALIDPNLLPNLFLSQHVKQVFDLYPKVLSTYSTVMGDAELREAMALYFMKRHGILVHTAELMVTTGSQQAIDLVSRALVKPGDTILIERPTYSPAIDAFLQQNIRLVPIGITPSGYDLEAVEQAMKRERPRLFYMNPTFHNPTGFTVSAAQRKALVELAERYQCVLVEDDVYHDIYFSSPPPPPLFFYDTEGYVIYIRSFSKYVAPGLRISFLAARQPVMSGIVPVKALSDNGTPLLNQKIFQHYFFSSRLQEHVAKLRTALQLRKERMEALLTHTGWRWTSPDGGLNLWVQLEDGFPVDALLARCLDVSAAFVPGSICDPLGQLDSWIRLSYSFLNESQITEGVSRLITAAGSVRNS